MSVLISYKVGGVWKTPDKPDIVDPVDPPVVSSSYSDVNAPWMLQAGESLLDNMPAGVPIYNASDYSTSRDIYTVLQAVGTATPSPGYVRLDLPGTYTMSDLKMSSTNNWIGWQNNLSGNNRKIMGFIGLGADQTFIKIVANCVNASPGARNWVLAATKAGGPVPVAAFYFTNTSSNIPLFFSGITFDGELQTPFGVYNTTVQGQFNQNQGVSSPLAWRGMAIWRAIAGARMQFCRFRGFGYALLNAPPFEMGAIDTNYSADFIIERTEIDGRVAAAYAPSRPLASGGLMLNKDIKILIRNAWLHHTRRSGFAQNTNTGRNDENPRVDNFQVENITGTDQYAAHTAGFPASNIEGFVGIFKYTNFYASVSYASHIYLAIPYSGEPGVYQVPDRPLVVVEGFRTKDTVYNGCLRVQVSKTPNSTGISPAWTKITNLGIAGSNLFDIRRSDGVALVGVKSTSFNPSIHKPETHFVAIYE